MTRTDPRPPSARPTGVAVGRLAAARMGSRRGVAAIAASVIALSVALICALQAWTGLLTVDALRAALPPADDPAGSMQVQTRPAADRAAQDRAADDLWAELFGTTVEVERFTVGEPGTDLERIAWRIVPRPLEPATIGTLTAGLQRLSEDFRSSDAAERGAIVTGELVEVVADVDAGATAAATIAPVPVSILAVLAWFAVFQLGRVLGTSRGGERALLRARGLDARQSGLLSLLDAVAVVGIGAVTGAVLAVAAVVPFRGEAGWSGLVSTAPVLGALVVVLVLTLAIEQTRSSRAASDRAASTGRGARLASPAVAVVVVVLTVVLVWLATTAPADASGWVLVLVTLAPVLGVIAVALLAGVVFPPLASVAAGIAARARGLAPAYSTRQVARRPAVYGVAVGLVAVSVAATAVAAAYAGTWRDTSRDAQRLAAGAPLRLTVDPVTPADIAAVTAVDGVESAVPAIVSPVSAGDTSATLVALPTADAEGVLLEVPGVVDPAAITAALEYESRAIPLPPGATAVAVRANVAVEDPQTASVVSARAWLTDGVGTPVPVPLRSAPTGDVVAGVLAVEGELPTSSVESQWRLIGVEVALGPTYSGAEAVFSGAVFTAITPEGDTDLAVDAADGAVLRAADPWDAGADPAIPSTLLWGAGGDGSERTPLALTSSLARALGLSVGDSIDLSAEGAGSAVLGTVRAVIPAVPGAGGRSGVLAPLDAIVEAPLVDSGVAGPAAVPPRANEIWAQGPPEASAVLAGELGVDVATPETRGAGVAGAVVSSWSIAAIGGAALAGVAVLALLTASTAQRATEVLILRAVGLPISTHVGMRIVEFVVVVVGAAALGLGGGAALAAILIPDLVGRSIPGLAFAPSLSFDPVPLAVGCLVMIVVVVVAAAGASAALRVQATRTRIDEVSS